MPITSPPFYQQISSSVFRLIASPPLRPTTTLSLMTMPPFPTQPSIWHRANSPLTPQHFPQRTSTIPAFPNTGQQRAGQTGSEHGTSGGGGGTGGAGEGTGGGQQNAQDPDPGFQPTGLVASMAVGAARGFLSNEIENRTGVSNTQATCSRATTGGSMGLATNAAQHATALGNDVGRRISQTVHPPSPPNPEWDRARALLSPNSTSLAQLNQACLGSSAAMSHFLIGRGRSSDSLFPQEIRIPVNEPLR